MVKRYYLAGDCYDAHSAYMGEVKRNWGDGPDEQRFVTEADYNAIIDALRDIYEWYSDDANDDRGGHALKVAEAALRLATSLSDAGSESPAP